MLCRVRLVDIILNLPADLFFDLSYQSAQDTV